MADEKTTHLRPIAINPLTDEAPPPANGCDPHDESAGVAIESSSPLSSSPPSPPPPPEAEDSPYSIKNLMLPPVAAAALAARREISRINMEVPRDKFARTCPDLPYSEGSGYGPGKSSRTFQLGILIDNPEKGRRRPYGCSPAVTMFYEQQGVKLIQRHTCYLAQFRLGTHILWAIKTPSIGGELSSSSLSQLEAAEAATKEWLYVEWNGSSYDRKYPLVEFPEPTWNLVKSWEDAIRLTFPGNDFIRDPENKLILQILGLA